MGAFVYSALDNRGRLKKGVETADSAKQVRQKLRDQGLAPVSVSPVEEQKAKSRLTVWRRKPPAAALSLVMRQLATMIKSGAVLGEALRVVTEQTEQIWAKRVFSSLRADVQEGQSLASAMAKFPDVFPDFFQATVTAGEHSGSLDVVLASLADYSEFRHRLNQKITLALAYPMLLTIVAFLIVIGLLGYVVPQIVTVFSNIDQQLPLLTRTVIWLSSFFRSCGIWLLLLLTGLVILARSLMNKESVRFRVHGKLLALPIIGSFLQGLEVARFSRTYSILVASGVTALEGMTIAAKVVSNLVLQKAIEDGARGVREGKSISQSLASSGHFPPMVIHLIASGEAGADLVNMLDQAASSQENEVEMMTGVATAIFEPLLILLMGGLVLLIVLAILMPVFELNQLVG